MLRIAVVKKIQRPPQRTGTSTHFTITTKMAPTTTTMVPTTTKMVPTTTKIIPTTTKTVPTTTKMVPTTTKMVLTTTKMVPTLTKMDLLQEQFNNISSSNDSQNSAIKFTKEIEDNLLVQAWNTLKLNQSRIFNTPSALYFIKIPVSGFTFPSERQQSLKNITESISFPDDLVKTNSGGKKC